MRSGRSAALWATMVGCAGAGAGCERDANPPAASEPHDASGAARSVAASADKIAAADDEAPDAEYGRQTFLSTCATCHGTRGQGMPHQGASLRDSRFVASAKDDGLLKFLQTGRPANDPANRSRMPMPPRGGNVSLSDARLRDVVAYLRSVQQEAASEASGREAAARD